MCGNGEPETGEECDDGDQVLDPVCSSNCQFTCGDGIKNFDELCDTALGSGEGACPTSCDDSQSCTSDLLSGRDCSATCVNSPITVDAAGDGCCLAGSNYNDDTDCPATCGNGAVEPPTEACDTGIPTGTGSCPATCNDSIACTTDTLTGTACNAACSFAPITQPANGDGCCPPGATDANDNDCPRAEQCGNGTVDDNETCDRAIPAGQPGACATSCNDNVPCTRNVLEQGGTCRAVCTFPAITEPANGDTCCPGGANNTNDNDCAPVCGNNVEETGEQCDDGNSNPNDGCHQCQDVALPPTAFRFTDLDLRDPHIRVGLGGFCLADVTDTPFAGFAVNPLIATAMSSDEDGDGLRDFSPVFVFRPLQQSSPTGPIQVGIGKCTLATPGTCRFDPAPAQVTATNLATGTCLTPIAGTTNVRPGYSPAVTNATGPCFSSQAQTISIVLAGIPITLADAQIASTYQGNPANQTINGLLRGFLSEAQADMIRLPADLPAPVGGQPLSLVLPGGTGNCAPTGTNNNQSDKDIHNGVPGWWFYLNFTAATVPWTE